MKLIILITSKIQGGMEVALAWQEAGAPGVTIIPSHGLHSLTEQVKRTSIELPTNVVSSMSATLAYITGQVEHTNYTILSVVPDDMVDKLIEAAKEELGDLMSPRTGVCFIVDIAQAIGVRDPRGDQE